MHVLSHQGPVQHAMTMGDANNIDPIVACKALPGIVRPSCSLHHKTRSAALPGGDACNCSDAGPQCRSHLGPSDAQDLMAGDLVHDQTVELQIHWMPKQVSM